MATQGRCPKCNSIRTQAYKDGVWSTVTALSMEAAQDYFQSTASMNRSQREQKLNSLRVVNHDSHAHKKRKLGESLPLGVWASRGFDIAQIEKDSSEEDKEWKQKLGWCYYVQTEADMEVESKGWKAEDQINDSTAAPEADTEAETAAARKLRLEEVRECFSNPKPSEFHI